VRFATVALVLFGLWLLFSGLFAPLLLALGALSCLFVTLVAKRMGLLEPDPGGIWLRPLRCLAYLPWFAWQVAKSNADVALRILVPSKGISPRVIRVPSTQRSDVGRTLYANSITLTPGTLTTNAHEDHLMVHALAEENITELRKGEMESRIRKLVL